MWDRARTKKQKDRNISTRNSEGQEVDTVDRFYIFSVTRRLTGAAAITENNELEKTMSVFLQVISPSIIPFLWMRNNY
jgi:hypothetical protein